MHTVLEKDIARYENRKAVPKFQIYYRKVQDSAPGIRQLFYKAMFRFHRTINHIDLDRSTKIGEGLYVGHPYCISINLKAVIGKNCNIHKGVTIGQENRGERKGTPIIGNNVWIGINSTIVGKITIGDDVLIAPNTYVNQDIPSHSVVLGNPCIIKHRDNATEGYISRTV